MTSPTFSNSNPNSFGGSFNYDSRTGLGIGSLGGDPNSGIGRNWSMGDALSSPKGEYEQYPWDGKFKSEILPVGSYYYFIEYNDESSKKINGVVTIILN